MEREHISGRDADAIAKRTEVAHALGGRRHLGEFKWVIGSRAPQGVTGLLRAECKNKQSGTAILIGHGYINDESKVIFTETFLLGYTKAEWTAFVDSVKGNEFDLPGDPSDTGHPNQPTAIAPPPDAEIPHLPADPVWIVIRQDGYFDPPAAA